MSEISFREPGRRTPATLLFTLLLGLNAIAADSPALTGFVIEVLTSPTPIPAQAGTISVADFTSPTFALTVSN